MRTTFTLEDELAAEAHRYGVPLSAAAREGVAAAVRRAKEARDRAAYLKHPETDDGWSGLEAWTGDGGAGE